MLGLRVTPGATAALLLNLEGLETIVIAWLVLRENAGRRILLGAFAILAAALVLSWQPGPTGFGWGALAIVGACLAWGIDNNLTRRLSGADPEQIAMVKGLAAGPVTLALALMQGAAPPSTGAALGAGAVGLIGYGVSLVLFVRALRHLGTARTGAYFSTAAFIGAALAVAMLGEPVTVQLVLAAILMALGVYLHVVERHEHEHAHEPMAHVHAHRHDAHHQHAIRPTTRPVSRTSTRTAIRPCCTAIGTIPTCSTGIHTPPRAPDSTQQRLNRLPIWRATAGFVPH